ncbi:MAG TPA: sigma-70 family RNA polymerase sigma factor, partial [Gemmataceae bacterium]|nr:sigma-70 family RNA polymerase sigma factor [Gemmataceae bacterium]
MSSSDVLTSVRRLRCLLAAKERPDESDEQLLHAFLCRRDESAFAILVRCYGPLVLHVCRRVLGHEQDAEDAFQATFLVLAQSAASLRKQTSLANFLHGTAYRTAMKAKQSAARRRKHERQAPSRPSVDPAEELSWREVRTLLDEEIARLPEIYRSVFILCSLENASREEAARRLHLKPGTVASRLAEARKRLAQRLARRGVELTAVLAAAALATPPASALPVELMATTIQAALALAAGEKLAGVVSASVAQLVKSATTAMVVSKAKIAVVLLLTASLLTGAGMWWSGGLKTLSGGRQPPERSETQGADAPRSGKREPAKTAEIQGRVLDPDGKPVSGAKLFEMRRTTAASSLSPDARLDGVGTTDGEGRFRVILRRPDSDAQTYLLGHATGFGVDWVDLSEGKRPSEVMLRLPKDVPIFGRIVNTEGRPVAGASVSITGIYVPANEKLDDYVKGGLDNFFDKLNNRTPKQLRVPLDGIVGKATTDKDGRFHIRGAGGERIVLITMSGGGVVRSTLQVITRPGFDAKPHNAAVRKYYEGREPVWLEIARSQFLYPPALEFIADAGYTIEGTVTDADSGTPIPGCRMIDDRGGATLDTATGDVVSGAKGEYRLEGLSKYDNVLVIPPKGSRYLSRSKEMANTARQTKVKLDIELAKGALVIGRVVDKQTGKGVQGSISFMPLAGNRFYGSKPGFDQRGYDGEQTDKDGRFRRATIPGRSLVLFQFVHQPEKLNGQDLGVYRGAVPDPEHKDIFIPDPLHGSWNVGKADGQFLVNVSGYYTAVKVIDAKEDGETRVELSVDRGATARIAVQDADGKPLAGAWAAGLTDHPLWLTTYKLPEATATVYALNPDEPREMAFFHAEKKLGGTATVRGDEKGQVVVKLAPLGQVFGRLLDADGNPLEGKEVLLSAQTRSGGELD